MLKLCINYLNGSIYSNDELMRIYHENLFNDYMKIIDNASGKHKVLFKLVKRKWTGNPFQIGVILDYLIFKEMVGNNHHIEGWVPEEIIPQLEGEIQWF